MNIYLIQEDGESFCIRANTMNAAIEICEASYLDIRRDDYLHSEKPEEIWLPYERNYYHENILQSCSLIGPLRN